MAKTSGEFEQEFIQTIQEKTGKTLEQWLSVVKSSGLNKPLEITHWLKSEQKLNHLQATLLQGLYQNGGKPFYQDESGLLENQFLKCESMRPLFEAVSEKIIKGFPGTKLIPKKTYLSFTAVREFAAINIKPKEIRLGLDLGNKPYTDTLQKSKLTGPMPRISHMLILTEPLRFDETTLACLQESYDRTHKK